MSIPVGPYTPVVKAGDFLFASGQIGLDDNAHPLEGVSAQARKALQNLKGLLEENGASLDKVVKTTVFLTDMASYNLMNEVYSEAFGEHRPARSAVAVHQLPKGVGFEIEAIAYVG